jgi:hypothetical protein
MNMDHLDTIKLIADGKLYGTELHSVLDELISEYNSSTLEPDKKAYYYDLPNKTDTERKGIAQQATSLLTAASISQPVHGTFIQFTNYFGKRARILPHSRHVLASYNRTIPDEITPMLVLDASYKVKFLERHERTMRDGQEAQLALKAVSSDLFGFKTYENVTQHHLQEGNGKSRIRDDLQGTSSRTKHTLR